MVEPIPDTCESAPTKGVSSIISGVVHKHCTFIIDFWVVSSYKESRNNMPIYGYNLSPSPKVQSVYNNNVALRRDLQYEREIS